MLFILSVSKYFLELLCARPRNWGRMLDRQVWSWSSRRLRFSLVLVIWVLPCPSAHSEIPWGRKRSPFCISSHSVLHVKAWPWLLLMVHTSLFYPHSQNLGLYCAFACSHLWVVLQGHCQSLACPHHSSWSVRHPFIFEGLDHTHVSFS